MKAKAQAVRANKAAKLPKSNRQKDGKGKKMKTPTEANKGNEGRTDQAQELEVKYVLRRQVRPDPDQPRKTFDKDKLQELADSIIAVGIRQPIQVEWVTGVQILEPDLVEKDWRVRHGKTLKTFATAGQAREFINERAKSGHTPDAHYRIVDGERRWRAAELAGVERVPVMIVDTSSPEWEKQKLAIQMVLNQQHENITALEEAAAYQREIESGRHTAESLYPALGISRGTLFSRLALNRVHPDVREALVTGKISTSIAGLMNMVPAQQLEAVLEDVTEGEYSGGPMSFREAQEFIERKYVKQLKNALFDTKDGELVPAEWIIRQGGKEAGQFAEFKAKGAKPNCEAQAEVARWMGMPEGGRFAVVTGEISKPKMLIDGVEKKAAQELAELINGKLGPTMTVTRTRGGACTDCPYRSGNIEGCGLKNPNVCTLPSCFAAKEAAHKKAIIASATEKGKTVLPANKTGSLFENYNPNDLRWNAPYVKPGDKCEADKKGRTYKELVGEAVPVVHALNANGTLVPLLDKEAVAKALKVVGIKPEREAGGYDYQAEQRRKQEKAKRLEAAAVPAMKELHEKVRAEKDELTFLRVVARDACNDHNFLKRRGWGGLSAMEKEVAKLDAAGLRLAIVEGISGDLVEEWNGEYSDSFEAVCEAYGVDLKRHAAEAKEKEKTGGGAVNAKSSPDGAKKKGAK